MGLGLKWRRRRQRCDELDTKVCTTGRRNPSSCITIPSPHSQIHSDTHTHTHSLKRLMPAQNPALLYLETGKDRASWLETSVNETGCAFYSKVCMKVRRGFFSRMTIPFPHTHIDTYPHTHIETSPDNRESGIALHWERKHRINWLETSVTWNKIWVRLENMHSSCLQYTRTHTHTHTRRLEKMKER